MVGLSINAEKTDLILFTRYQNGTLTKICAARLTQFWTASWVKKATVALYAFKKMLSSTWGVSPALMHWIYISVMRPTLLYGAIVWW